MKFTIKLGHLLLIIVVILLCVIWACTVNAERYTMTFLYGNGNYISMIERTNDTLDEVSPSYFDINSSGGLILNNIDSSFVSKVHEKGIKVVPFLSNHWDKSNRKGCTFK